MCKIKQMIAFHEAWLVNCEPIFLSPYLIYLEIGVELCVLTTNYMLFLLDINHRISSHKIQNGLVCSLSHYGLSITD